MGLLSKIGRRFVGYEAEIIQAGMLGGALGLGLAAIVRAKDRKKKRRKKILLHDQGG